MIVNIADYNYDLPADRIAQRPLGERDASLLLVYWEGQITDEHFSDIDKIIPEGSLLVFNDTKVVRARLMFSKSTGGAIEIFCLEPIAPTTDLQLAFQQQSACRWNCLVGNSKKWKNEVLFKALDNQGSWLKAERKASTADGCFEIEFSWDPDSLSFSDILTAAGQVPLPPYIIRESDDEDARRYQTVYARHEGSVAAPTAGLHFTEDILERLRRRDCREETVTLHVGLGTFKPVSVPDIRQHVMHSEHFVVKRSSLIALRSSLEKPVIAVGTTSARTLESLYWLGARVIADPQTELMQVNQWEPYELPGHVLPSPGESLDALIRYLERKNLNECQGSTSLIIMPGYQFRIVSSLITNFHMPKSTLLLLIAALAGEGWKNAYAHALANAYRFLSYGDACLFL
ncbi:MAG: S-adenosylmethionine:tRNA ribosyltransferase-isomerase [Bacteroidales bacterium]